MRKQQQGVALVIALVITSVAVSLASLAMYRQQLQIRLSGNISHLEQAYEYALGMEDWSRKILEKDFKDNPNVDHLKEDWATVIPPIPIPGGSLNGQLFDLQGRINLNSLLYEFNSKQVSTGTSAGGGVTVYKTDDLIYERIVKIVQYADDEQLMGPPQNFVDALWDWIDKDDNERPGGAESNNYQSLEVPYLSANSEIIEPSEIMLLKGMDKKIYKKMIPFINTSPSREININTAPIEVLEAIGFDSTTAKGIIDERNDKPFESMKDFWSNSNVKTFFAPKSEMGKRQKDYSLTITNKSNYFLLQGSVDIRNARININSVLKRSKGKVSVISRDFGTIRIN